MKLNYVEKENIPCKNYSRAKYINLIKEFEKSDASAARVDGIESVRVDTVRASFGVILKRYGVTGIKVITRDKKVYLVKEG